MAVGARQAVSLAKVRRTPALFEKTARSAAARAARLVEKARMQVPLVNGCLHGRKETHALHALPEWHLQGPSYLPLSSSLRCSEVRRNSLRRQPPGIPACVNTALGNPLQRQRSRRHFLRTRHFSVRCLFQLGGFFFQSGQTQRYFSTYSTILRQHSLHQQLSPLSLPAGHLVFDLY